MKRILIVLCLLCLFMTISTQAQEKNQLPEYSKAGFYELPNSGREIFNFNVGWRFYKGEQNGAEATDFDDSNWPVVNTPHGLELGTTQFSGSKNYQGEAWYRKHFEVPAQVSDKRLVLHFEAVMGKCKVFLNGKLLKSHFGGYLPFQVDLTEELKKGEENVLAVWADNSDDVTYPPGKSQKRLDFTYFGGIYRDVWLLATNDVYITNPNHVDKVAGGGLFIHYENLSDEQVDMVVETDITNNQSSAQQIGVEFVLKTKAGVVVAKGQQELSLQANSDGQAQHRLQVNKPALWSPQSPTLYQLEVQLKNSENVVIDGVREKIGIRKIEFRGKEGFYLNNKPYDGKLMGANRHQDFAYVGNALPNSGQWRDALLLKPASKFQYVVYRRT